MILAGGLGTRLRPYTLFLPKPMLPVGPKPILEHILDWLKQAGITEEVIATGYLGRYIESYFKDGKDFGLKIQYAASDRPLGHAGQLKSAGRRLSSRFVCTYGDAILDFDLKKLTEFHRKSDALLTMALMEHETPMKYGVIDVDSSGRIKEWREKPVVRGTINVGCYVMEKRFLDYIPEGQVYGMKEAFEAAMKKNEPIYALKVKGSFIDIGDKRAHKEADAEFIKRYGKIP